MTHEEVLAAYANAWNTDDDNQRRALLERAWADDGELVDPTGRFDGREAVMQLIIDTRSQVGNLQVSATTGYDRHHNWVRFGWRIAADGSTISEGIDAVELADDGRIKRIVGFEGPFPEL